MTRRRRILGDFLCGLARSSGVPGYRAHIDSCQRTQITRLIRVTNGNEGKEICQTTIVLTTSRAKTTTFIVLGSWQPRTSPHQPRRPSRSDLRLVDILQLTAADWAPASRRPGISMQTIVFFLINGGSLAAPWLTATLISRKDSRRAKENAAQIKRCSRPPATCCLIHFLPVSLSLHKSLVHRSYEVLQIGCDFAVAGLWHRGHECDMQAQD